MIVLRSYMLQNSIFNSTDYMPSQIRAYWQNSGLLIVQKSNLLSVIKTVIISNLVDKLENFFIFFGGTLLPNEEHLSGRIL